MDLRVVTLTIPPQEVITRDNVPARINAVVLFRVVGVCWAHTGPPAGYEVLPDVGPPTLTVGVHDVALLDQPASPEPALA